MTFVQKHKMALKILLLAYIVFAGCFSFPIHSEQCKLDFMRIYLFIIQYGIIGTSFKVLYGANNSKVVYTATLVFTIIGLGCRYLLELGEVSNIYNFTLPNIIAYLVIIPLGTLVTYFVSTKSTERKED